MATSGITTNQLTRNQFIEAALRSLGVLALDQTPAATEYTSALVKLNALVGEFRTKGLQIWQRSEYTMALTNGTSSYSIGTGQTFNTPYPLHLLQAVRLDSTQGTRIPIDIIADYNFNLLPSNSSGTPIQVRYQPGINVGTLRVWPTPDSYAASNVTILLTYLRPLEYFSASTDTADFPEEWVSAIIYGLAVRLAPEYGVPLQDRQLLQKEAEMYLKIAEDNSYEDASLFIQPMVRPQ
jgi:hypothetical protein